MTDHPETMTDGRYPFVNVPLHPGTAHDPAASEPIVEEEEPADPNAPVTITLESPLTRGANTIRTVTLRCPKLRDLTGISMAAVLQLEPGSLRALLPRITDPALSPRDLNGMPIADVLQLGTAAAAFFLTAEQKSAGY
jgi:hypothetical protein